MNQKWIPGWKNSWAYFHLSLNCIKLVKSYVEVEDIYIPNDIRESLSNWPYREIEENGVVAKNENEILKGSTFSQCLLYFRMVKSKRKYW